MEREKLLAAHAHRHIKLEGARNVRDLGGLVTQDGRTTRHGRVYRSDSWSELSANDHARLHALNLQAVVDFRTDDERTRAPDLFPPQLALKVYTPGFFPHGNQEMIAAINAGTLDAPNARATMLDQYRNLTLDHCEIYRDLIEALLTPDHIPLVFHCASGKDRTGLAAAVVLLAVGVAPLLVVEDYVISNFQRRKVSLFGDAPTNPAIEPVMSAHRDYIEHAIKVMEEAYGSIDGYLETGIRLESQARTALKMLLVE